MKSIPTSKKITLLSFVIVLTIFGCKAQNKVADSTLNYTTGEEIKVELEQNITTGYRWVQAANSDSTIVTLVKSEYISNEEIIGGPGKVMFTFKALKPGKTTIELQYARSWESKPAETRTYNFAISAKK